jgi:hypothetical protein
VAEMKPETVKLFYEESKAARDALDDILKQYRTNATAVLALATGAATFFGFKDGPKGGWFAASLVAYAVAVLAAAVAYWPRPWAMNPAADIGAVLSTPNEAVLPVIQAHFDLGKAYQREFTLNRASLKEVQWCYQVLVAATAAVIILAGISATREAPAATPKPTHIVIDKEK